MTVEHIVLLEFQEDADPAAIEAAVAGIHKLKGAVPGVLEVKTGKNFTDRAGAITHAAIVTLEDKAALEGYGPHPAHQEVAGALRAIAKSLMAVDFER